MKFLSIKRKFILNSIMMIFAFPLYAIQKTTANIATGAIVAAAVAGSYKIWSATKDEVHPAIFSVLSLLVGLSSYYYLHTFTPEGLLKTAEDHLDGLMRYKLAKSSFDEDKMFFNAIHDIYLTKDLPLISAYNQLISLLPKMHYIFDVLSQASEEIYEDSPLEEKYDFLVFRADTTFNNISEALKRIRAHKDYLLQLQIYKEFLTNKS